MYAYVVKLEQPIRPELTTYVYSFSKPTPPTTHTRMHTSKYVVKLEQPQHELNLTIYIHFQNLYHPPLTYNTRVYT